MEKVSLKKVAALMKNLDFCMMVTKDGRNTLHSRPMSNNGKVDYDGDSYFFSYRDSNKVKQIENNPMISLIFQTDDMIYLDCYGMATVTENRKMLEEKWVKGLEMWFPEGINTEGICLIKVSAHR
ncbi:MAG: pyridoxamine 5'-phosphate oxidase family protein, partial [Kaistella sp.]